MEKGKVLIMGIFGKVLLSISIIFVVLGMLFISESGGSGDLRLIFCDVGQGDGMLIISPGDKQIVVDGGPGTKIIDCLSENMPFWDRTIDLVVLTHPQKDHMEGLIEVLNRFEVSTIMTTGVESDTKVFDTWSGAVETEGAKFVTAKAGDRILPDGDDSVELRVIWPTGDKLEEWDEKAPRDLNDVSVVMRLNFGNFCAYLTGDLAKEILEDVVNKKCQVLKVSHHGSRTGTNEGILGTVDPDVAVIQVGRNGFGHPHGEVVDLLSAQDIEIYRNDQKGDIEVTTDGSSYSVGRSQ